LPHPSKPKLLVIGRTYATSFNRRKLTALTAFFSVTCVTSELGRETLFGLPIKDFEENDVVEQFDLHRLREWPSNQKFTRFFYLSLRRLFLEKRFDYVLVDSEPWAFGKWQAWLLTRLYQPNATFGEFSWENVERAGLKGALLSLVYRASVLADDFTISGNQACRAILLKRGARPDRNLTAAQLGVESTLFYPISPEKKRAIRAGMDLPATAFIVGFCGRLVPEKGLDELYQAVRRLRQADRHVHLAVLGDGPLAEPLVKGGESWLHLFPPRPHFKIPPFMQSLDLFVLPSKPLRKKNRLWEEQFGHVLIEAMACGVPTIGSSSGAIPEVLSDPKAVFLHTDVDALFKSLLFFLSTPSERQALADRQLERVRMHYTHEAVARIYSDFLLSVRCASRSAK
jgi:glycosyltransferase involved in cell wall biosynthesis